MEFSLKRNHILVEAETESDDAYIEDTLGLKRSGDWCQLVRRNITRGVPGGPSEVSMIELVTQPKKGKR